MKSYKKLFSKKKVISSFIFVFCILYFVFFPSCSNSTSSDNSLTLSGTVTLEDTTNYSGVKVMVFEPVEIDTVFTNLNEKYPTVGILATQRNQFYWWEQTPLYQTTTASDGSWKIKNVPQGTYHIVFEKEGYGWKVIYNAPFQQNHVQLFHAIELKGVINQNMTIPENHFVIVAGDVSFEQGKTLTIEPDVTVEFINNGKLEANGQMLCNGIENKEIFFISREPSNTSKVDLNTSNNSNVTYVVFNNLRGGLNISNSNNVSIANSTFQDEEDAITLFNCSEVEIRSNILNKLRKGLGTDASSNNLLEKNFFLNISYYGVDAFNENNSLIQRNVFKKCENFGVGINSEGAPGSIFKLHNLDIYFNDFINNQNHIKIGRNAFCNANQNNFMNSQEYIVWVLPINYVDTLNFHNNYWGFTNLTQIEEKIYDKLDQPNATDNVPTVDFSNYQISYIKWQ